MLGPGVFLDVSKVKGRKKITLCLHVLRKLILLSRLSVTGSFKALPARRLELDALIAALWPPCK